MYDSEEETIVSLMNRDCDVNAPGDDDYSHNFKTLANKKHKSIFVKSRRTEELTPLHISVIEGFSDVANYLIDNGANVNRPDKILQFTPLHLAIYQHRYDLLQLLIEKGANVDGSGKDNLTPLHLAALLGCPRFAEALIQHGANVNNRYNDDQLTPLHLATIRSHLADNEERLTGAEAIRHGNEKSLIVKLMDHPYDPISQDYAAVIRLLLANGADVDASTRAGWTTLHHALRNNDEALVDVLMDAGADVNVPTKDGKSPLHLALECNCTDILKLLLQSGAKLNCKGTRCLYTLLYVTTRINDEHPVVDDLVERSPLFRAISSLDNTEIQRAVTCLCAIVDATNQTSCMPVNSEIQSDYADCSRSLRISRVNVHDTEVYAKFVCDRVLSGALEELGYNCLEMRKPQYVYDYLSMLNAVNLPLVRNYMTSRTQSIADMYSHNKVKTHYESCLEEVEKMKSHAVNERGVTLYEVLHMRPKKRRCYTKHLDLCKIKSEFEIYYKLILARYREDVVKRALMDEARSALSVLVGMELPIICVEEIFADLGVMNVIATIQAAERID